jgi:DNA-binding transcriptional MerR regulator
MENDRLIPPGEAAEILGVSPKTLTRWASLPKDHRAHVPSVRTLGGHRRYRESVIRAILKANSPN